MSKLNLQPIIRNVSTDKHDAGNWKHREEYPVYYAMTEVTLLRKELSLYIS